MKKNSDLVVILIVAGCLVGMFPLYCLAVRGDRVRKFDPIVAWDIYHGQVESADTTYIVRIEDVDRGKGLRREVHMEQAGTPIFTGITGHDYDGDDDWDRVFYCGEHPLVEAFPQRQGGLGCNSVVRTAEGWLFEPCPMDQGFIKPFSKEAIAFAIRELENSLDRLYNDQHLVEHWEWDELLQKTVRTWKKKG